MINNIIGSPWFDAIKKNIKLLFLIRGNVLSLIFRKIVLSILIKSNLKIVSAYLVMLILFNEVLLVINIYMRYTEVPVPNIDKKAIDVVQGLLICVHSDGLRKCRIEEMECAYPANFARIVEALPLVLLPPRRNNKAKMPLQNCVDFCNFDDSFNEIRETFFNRIFDRGSNIGFFNDEADKSIFVFF